MSDEIVRFDAITTDNGDIVPYVMIVSMRESGHFYDILGNLHQTVKSEREFYVEWLKSKIQ